MTMKPVKVVHQEYEKVGDGYWSTIEGTRELQMINAQIDRITYDALARAPAHARRTPRRLRFGRILVAIDGSNSSRLALEWGVAFARCYGAKISLVTVSAPLGVYEYIVPQHETLPVNLEDLSQRILDDGLRQVREAGLAATGRIEHGSPVGAICDRAADEPADLVIVGSHGSGAAMRLVLGSTADGVKNRASTNVLVARGHPPAKRILVPTDGSIPSREAALVARDLSRAWKGETSVLYVIPSPAFRSPKKFASFFENLRGDLSLGRQDASRVAYAVQYGDPAAQVIQTARKDDFPLIVMGCRGLGGLKGFVAGSVSSKTVHRSSSAVLLIKEPA